MSAPAVPAVPASLADSTPWGPTGRIVFERTYSRTKPDGSKETWPETVRRVAEGNLRLVYGDGSWPQEVLHEYERLVYYMERFALLPAGRHLWATGAAPGRNYLMNCHTAGWGEKLSEHFEFSFLRLMEGGGVGSNYSGKYTGRYGAPVRKVTPHIICDPLHPDTAELHPHLSDRYIPESFADVEVEDSREGWALALCSLIDSFYGDGICQGDACCDGEELRDTDLVYDVSGIRPSGSPLHTFGGTASGPAPFARMMLSVAEVLNSSYDRGSFTPLDAMEIDHAIAECVVSGGNRRSARMSIVRWDDPYIFEFLKCKEIPGLHWTTNISVEVDDKFLKALSRPYKFEDNHLAHGVHAAVVKGMLTNGEPGYWNSSLSRQGEIREAFSPNPCGEQILEQWEACCLGHVNLDYFCDKPLGHLIEAHRLMTRFLVRATFSDINDPKQKEVENRNRRIGVGHLGVQGYWAKKGVKYSGIPSMAPGMLRLLYKEVRQAARDYTFQLRIPEPVKVTTVAPTGSVAKLPGVSEGIHPVYARYFERRVRFSKRDEGQFQMVMEALNKGFTVEDDIYDQSGMTAVVVYPTEDLLLSQVRALGLPDDVVQSADELNVRQMLDVQRVYQKCWADNAVSYTVNIPEGTCPESVLANTLAEYLPDLKGTTVMVDASRPQAPYTRITREQYEAATATAIEDSTSEECSSGACPVR